MTQTPKPQATPANDSPRCPQCDKPAAVRYRPFCSKRCADLDLGHWLTDSYVLPGDSEILDPVDSDLD